MPPHHTYRAWTSRELDTVAAMRGEGRTLAEIAAALGRSPASVRSRVHAPDLRGELARPPRSRRWWQWHDELSVARPDREHAERMGASPNTVKVMRQRMRRDGIPAPSTAPAPVPPGRKEEARRLRRAGLTLAEVARRTGISISWVSALVRRSG